MSTSCVCAPSVSSADCRARSGRLDRARVYIHNNTRGAAGAGCRCGAGPPTSNYQYRLPGRSVPVLFIYEVQTAYMSVFIRPPAGTGAGRECRKKYRYREPGTSTCSGRVELVSTV